MNFFEHQTRARRRTGLLVAYFTLALLLTMAAVNLACLLAWQWLAQPITLTAWLGSPPALWIAGATLLIVAGGSALRFWQLRGGGAALAGMLQARRIDPDTRLADERQLVNVVEEMAIASGIPVPQLFVLDNEPAINALVAGFRPTETSVIVTRGALQQLDRDELQGVIAHEFSHVFNADMRLNLRLIAALAGILAIGKTGEFLLHSVRHGAASARSSRNNGAGLLVVAGLALMVIGYIGLFFGRLIKAAISRQRELLADAGSVQFTRNPAGIAGALIRIRNGEGSHLNSRHAEDMSHMCFGETLTFRLRGLLATHPSVDERLAALGTPWLARARVDTRQRAAAPAPATATASGTTPAQAHAFAETATPLAATVPSAAHAAATVGTVTPAHLGYARRIHESIPESLRTALHRSDEAELVMYALVLSVSDGEPGPLLDTLALPPASAERVSQRLRQVQALGTRLRLPLADLAIPALKQAPQADRDRLLARLDALIRADQRVTLFEFVLTHILADHLGHGAHRNPTVAFRSYRPLAADIRLLLSVMVHASGARDDTATRQFHGLSAAVLPPGTALLPINECKLDALSRALMRLARLTPLLKAGLVDACADAVLADGRVQVREAELLRAVCTLLDCPMPPLFTGDQDG